MKKRLSLSDKTGLLLLTFAVAIPAHAQDGSWIQDTSGPWEEPSAWSDGVIADGEDSTAIFSRDIQDDVFVILGESRTIGHLQFSDTGVATPGNWGILDVGAGSVLTLKTSTAVPTITVGTMGGGRAVNVDAVLSGTQGFTKLGSGTLRLNRANTYTGLTTVSAGFLTLGSTDGNAVNGNIVLDGVTTRMELAATNQIADNAIITFSENSAARFRLQGFDETIGGLQSNGGTGVRIVEAATDNMSNAPATLTLNVAAGETYNFDGHVRNAWQGINSALSITKEGEGTQIFSGGNALVAYSGVTTINEGVLEFTNGTFANNSVINLGKDGTVRFSNPANGNRSGIITGEGNLEHAGANLLGLQGANTYTGLTIITSGAIFLNANAGNTINGDILFNGGNLRLGQAHQIADTSVLRFQDGIRGRFTMHGLNETIGGLDSGGGSDVHVVESALDNVNNSPATLGINTAEGESYVYSGFLRDSFNGNNSALTVIKTGEGTQVFSGGDGRVTHTGDTVINQGVIEVTGSTTLVNSDVQLGADGTIRFNNNVNAERSRVISGAGSVEVVGSSTLVFSADNTYTGSTLVDNGMLVVDGDQSAATGDVTVRMGGALAGTGIIGGRTTIGGSLNPGNGGGDTLTFNENLTLESTSTTTFEIISMSIFDALANDGSAAILFEDGATVIFDFSGYAPSANDSFLLLNNWNERVVVGDINFLTNNLDSNYWVDTSEFLTSGMVTVVPEPATVGAIMACSMLIAVGARRIVYRKNNPRR